MDYGSIVCTPRNPNCTICLIKKNCFSFQKNIQNSIPAKTKSNTIKRKKFSRAYICLNENNEIWKFLDIREKMFIEIKILGEKNYLFDLNSVGYGLRRYNVAEKKKKILHTK